MIIYSYFFVCDFKLYNLSNYKQNNIANNISCKKTLQQNNVSDYIQNKNPNNQQNNQH